MPLSIIHRYQLSPAVVQEIVAALESILAVPHMESMLSTIAHAHA